MRAAFILALLLASGAVAKTPAIYNHTGKYVLFVDPADEERVQVAAVLADHTQIEVFGPASGDVDVLFNILSAAKNKDQFENGANGFKVHVLGEFPYRESSDTNDNPTICVPVDKPAKGEAVETCYIAYPRSDSVLDKVQQKGVNRVAHA